MELIPDSEWLASMVVAAYTEQRYDLGLALARLQMQAVSMERDSAQLPAASIVPSEVYEPEHRHVQEHEQETGQKLPIDGQELPIDRCQDCGMRIRWSVRFQVWSHLDDAGYVVTSPLPPHDGRPAPAINEDAPAAPAQETPAPIQPVTPSARCIAIVGSPGKQRECHGVLVWHSEGESTTYGMSWEPPGWVHMDGDVGHEPIPNRTDVVPS